MKYPHEVQAEWLKRLVLVARDTEWGRKYDYRSITSLKEFRERVPISDYDSFKLYIDRMRRGEKNILWPSDIKLFAKSSGTTSDKSKYIPLSNEALEECHYKGGKDLLSIYCNNNPNTYMFDGLGLTMGGSQKITEVNNEEFIVGDLSAIMIHNLPFWAEYRRTPSVSIALMSEWESKIKKMAQATMKRNVTSISGVPSWSLVLIKKILELSGKSNLMEIWPNLEVFFHGGVNFNPYREQYKRLIPDGNMKYMETYNASEGFFGIQDISDNEELLLMLDYGIFYEFLPMDLINDEDPKAISLEDVEINKNYALVISTNGGLWRYVIGDTIIFTSLNPYRIKITGRIKNFINIVGEELIIDNAEKALATACQQTHSVVNEYSAGPVHFTDSDNAAHEWLIEFETPPDDLNYFTEVFDKALKSVNSDYEAKRHRNMVLRDPIVKSVSPGTFYKWMKNRGKLGGQHKVPRLSNDRKHVDDILSL